MYNDKDVIKELRKIAVKSMLSQIKPTIIRRCKQILMRGMLIQLICILLNTLGVIRVNSLGLCLPLAAAGIYAVITYIVLIRIHTKEIMRVIREYKEED